MNTADVRGMASGQWVFWVAGLPLTAIVILVSLLWAGELGNFWAYIKYLLSYLVPIREYIDIEEV